MIAASHLKNLALAGVLAGILAGCTGSASSGTESVSGGTTPSTNGTTSSSMPGRSLASGEGVDATGNTIKIGVVGSLTGDQKPWGEDSIRGAEMALKEFNDAGGLDGKKVEMLTGDSGSKADQAKTAAEKLLSDGVIALVGEVSSGNTIQMAKSAFGKIVPVVGIGATNPKLTEEGGNVVRVCYTDDFQGPVMAKFAYEELGLRNVGVITDNKQPYSQGLSASFGEAFTKLGGKIVGESKYESAQSDFTGLVTELKAKNPDGLFLSGYFPEVGPLAQQIRQGGMKDIPLLGGDGWDGTQLLTSGGQAILDSYFCNHYNNKETRPEVTQFLTKWKAANGGKDPGTTMAALGYDAMALTLDALKRAGKPNSKAIVEALNDTENFQGVSGVITLKGANGNPAKRALVVKVRPASEGFQIFQKAIEPGDVSK